jgi:hypothetical protein
VVVADCDEDMIVQCFMARPEGARPACCLASLSAGEVRAMLDTEVGVCRLYIFHILIFLNYEGLQITFIPHTFLSSFALVGLMGSIRFELGPRVRDR